MPFHFAYGSNMDLDQLIERCPSANFLCPAQARDHRLVFTRFSTKRKSGVADITVSRGASVWGAIFEMTDHDATKLDQKEGVFLNPPAYRRVSLTVLKNGAPQNTLETFSYQVVEPAIQPIKPSAEYMKLIINGAIRWKLPSDYIEELQRIEVA